MTDAPISRPTIARAPTLRPVTEGRDTASLREHEMKVQRDFRLHAIRLRAAALAQGRSLLSIGLMSSADLTTNEPASGEIARLLGVYNRVSGGP